MANLTPLQTALLQRLHAAGAAGVPSADLTVGERSTAGSLCRRELAARNEGKTDQGHVAYYVATPAAEAALQEAGVLPRPPVPPVPPAAPDGTKRCGHRQRPGDHILCWLSGHEGPLHYGYGYAWCACGSASVSAEHAATLPHAANCPLAAPGAAAEQIARLMAGHLAAALALTPGQAALLQPLLRGATAEGGALRLALFVGTLERLGGPLEAGLPDLEIARALGLTTPQVHLLVAELRQALGPALAADATAEAIAWGHLRVLALAGTLEGLVQEVAEIINQVGKHDPAAAERARVRYSLPPTHDPVEDGAALVPMAPQPPAPAPGEPPPREPPPPSQRRILPIRPGIVLPQAMCAHCGAAPVRDTDRFCSDPCAKACTGDPATCCPARRLSGPGWSARIQQEAPLLVMGTLAGRLPFSYRHHQAQETFAVSVSDGPDAEAWTLHGVLPVLGGRADLVDRIEEYLRRWRDMTAPGTTTAQSGEVIHLQPPPTLDDRRPPDELIVSDAGLSLRVGEGTVRLTLLAGWCEPGPEGALWAAGDHGVILRAAQGTDGWILTRAGSSPGERIQALSGTGPRDLWAVGTGGRILRWTGSAWAEVRTGLERNAYGVPLSQVDLYAVVAEVPAPHARLRAGRVFVVGSRGTVLVREPDGTWATEGPSPVPLPALYGLALGQDGLWAVGARGTVVLRHADAVAGQVGRWTVLQAVTRADLHALSISAGDEDMVVVGRHGTVLRRDGGRWVHEPLGFSPHLTAAVHTPAGPLVAGQGPVVFRSAAGEWQRCPLWPLTEITSENLVHLTPDGRGLGSRGGRYAVCLDAHRTLQPEVRNA